MKYSISQILKKDKLVILNTFNVCVGSNLQTWQGGIGRYGIQKCISNSLLFPRKCIKQFYHNKQEQIFFDSPPFKHWCLIDCIIVSKYDFKPAIHEKNGVLDRPSSHLHSVQRPHQNTSKTQGKMFLKKININKLNIDPVKTRVTGR